MTSQTATAEQIIGGLGLSSEWQCQPEAVKKALLPHVAKIPQLLASRMNKPVNLETWAEAKKIFLEHLRDNGYAAALCDCETETPRGKGKFVRSVDAALSNNISTLEMLLDWAKDQTVNRNDRELLVGIGLSGIALQLFDMGRLTIADLLKLKPTLIILIQ